MLCAVGRRKYRCRERPKWRLPPGTNVRPAGYRQAKRGVLSGEDIVSDHASGYSALGAQGIQELRMIGGERGSRTLLTQAEIINHLASLQ